MANLDPYHFSASASVKSVTETADGSLKIAGYAAVFDEIDREDEAFLPGAFTAGIRQFLSGNRPICFHHRLDDVIGRVTDARVVEGVGLWVEGIIFYQHHNSPLRHVWEAIRAGAIDGYSVGGYFKRKLTDLGPRIYEVDLVEVSATAAPVGGHATTFEVRDVKGITVNIKSITRRKRTANAPVVVGGGQAAGITEVKPAEVEELSATESMDRNERWAEYRRERMAKRYAKTQEMLMEGHDAPVWKPIPADPPSWFEGPLDGQTTIYRWVEEKPDESMLQRLNRAALKGEKAPEPTKRLVKTVFSEPSPEDRFRAEAPETPSRPKWSDL